MNTIMQCQRKRLERKPTGIIRMAFFYGLLVVVSNLIMDEVRGSEKSKCWEGGDCAGRSAVVFGADGRRLSSTSFDLRHGAGIGGELVKDRGIGERSNIQSNQVAGLLAACAQVVGYVGGAAGISDPTGKTIIRTRIRASP